MLGQLARPDRVVLADFEAGLGTVLRLDAPVDVVVIVVEPTVKSLEVGRRAAETVLEARLGRIVVTANRVRDETDAQRVRAAFPGLSIGMVPVAPRRRRLRSDGASAVKGLSDTRVPAGLSSKARMNIPTFRKITQLTSVSSRPSPRVQALLCQMAAGREVPQ